MRHLAAAHGLVPTRPARSSRPGAHTAGSPIERYGNPLSGYVWVAFLGVVVNAVGLAIGVLGGPQ